MSLVDKMFKTNPNRNPVFTAIDVLHISAEILKFRGDYRRYLVAEGHNAEVANHNIGYILGYYDKDTRDHWYAVLEIGHPIFPHLSTGTTNLEEN